MNNELYVSVSAFIDYENSLLDAKNYDAWLPLWQDDGMYVVPIDTSDDDYGSRLNYAYDDADMRRMRVARLLSGESVSVESNGGTIRLTSRLRVNQVEDVIEARCALLINESRLGVMKQYVANVEYQLIPSGDSFAIAQKVVKLINAEDYLRTISYIL
ncbi:aromatic-ring-hydroxylating dioxygenase subunit beta [Psychrobacter aestuarii]|uniref:Aromatic-ring-hydroxylating dioxygenase subunit beta n=1 Tax=Psychrobacter aestuarii TaxID=556327 RepID=A0ABN0VRW6_9GAMM|nr:aromatic-ring-hydroxylating dioxygenase subunit beta [Psychrobacter aestuarii]